MNKVFFLLGLICMTVGMFGSHNVTKDWMAFIFGGLITIVAFAVANSRGERERKRQNTLATDCLEKMKNDPCY